MKQVKHTIQLEFTIPENHGDLCWTSEGCGTQMYHDLLVKEAKNSIWRQISQKQTEISKREDNTETKSDTQYLTWLENHITLIDAIKVTNISTEVI